MFAMFSYTKLQYGVPIVDLTTRFLTRLGDVQNRLKETSDEFETTRKRARRAKMEFEAVQKQR